MEVVPAKDGAFTGGLVNNVIRLSKSMTNAGHNVKIITTDVNRSLEKETQEFNWGTVRAINVNGKYSSVRNNIDFLLKIIPVLKNEEKLNKIDMIHVHSAYSLFSAVSFLASFFLKKPVIFTLYSPAYNAPLNDRKGFYQVLSSGLFTKFFLTRSGKLSCLSQNIKRSLSDLGIEKDIKIIPPIVDPGVFSPNLNAFKKRNELGIHNASKVILYCGSWTEWKGVHLLVQSLEELKKDFPDIKLITAWGEPYDWYDERKSKLNELIHLLGLHENIIELGVVNDMQNLMAACDIFVAPFLNIDGVADPPLSILEAMSCGKIVVVTKVGSLPQIIKEGSNGFLVNPNDVYELTGALRNALFYLENGNKIGINAADYVSRYYSSSTVTRILLDIYDELKNEVKS